MKIELTKEKLDAFSQEISELYRQKKIRSPIHLEGSIDGKLERFLINFFKKNKIGRDTWIFGTHRSHFLWLLSGRDPEKLKKQILDGHSMHIFGHKFFTSAIVGGVAPIALGVAKALAMKGSEETVYCFIGDSAFRCGIVQESIYYASHQNLPILYIVLDNHFSVTTETKIAWGNRLEKNKVTQIEYDRKYPHAGIGQYVMF